MTKAAQLDALWQQLRALALAPDAAPAPSVQRLAFEELWEPRTPQTTTATTLREFITTVLKPALPVGNAS